MTVTLTAYMDEVSIIMELLVYLSIEGFFEAEGGGLIVCDAMSRKRSDWTTLRFSNLQH